MRCHGGDFRREEPRKCDSRCHGNEWGREADGNARVISDLFAFEKRESFLDYNSGAHLAPARGKAKKNPPADL